MYYFFVCHRAHSKLKDNPKVFSSPLSPRKARRDVAASVAAVIMNGICISLRTPAPKALSLFSYSQPHELPFARGILRLHTHTQTLAQPLQRVRERKRVYSSRAGGGEQYLKLIFYYHLFLRSKRCVPQISPSQVFA